MSCSEQDRWKTRWDFPRICSSMKFTVAGYSSSFWISFCVTSYTICLLKNANNMLWIMYLECKMETLYIPLDFPYYYEFSLTYHHYLLWSILLNAAIATTHLLNCKKKPFIYRIFSFGICSRCIERCWLWCEMAYLNFIYNKKTNKNKYSNYYSYGWYKMQQKTLSGWGTTFLSMNTLKRVPGMHRNFFSIAFYLRWNCCLQWGCLAKSMLSHLLLLTTGFRNSFLIYFIGFFSSGKWKWLYWWYEVLMRLV